MPVFLGKNIGAVDAQYDLGLVEDVEASGDENRVALQDAFDAGATRSRYPLSMPGGTGAYTAYFIDDTLVLPADSGRAWVGAGFTKYGESSNTRGAQIVLRAMNERTAFDGTTNRLETSGASATVTVVGRAVTTRDQYNSVQITGGSLATTGWYGIASVHVGNNTWTLDRNVTSGTSTNIQGVYCPELVRNHGLGTIHRGLYFSARRLQDDTNIGGVGYHIATNQISSGVNTGNHSFEHCSFNYFHTGMLLGHDMANYGGSSYAGSGDNHCDNLKCWHNWFSNCNNCFVFRNQQSVCHEIISTRASELNGTVFHFDAGGDLKAIGVEVNGDGSGSVQRLLYLGPLTGGTYSPYVISGFRFDGGNSTRNPQLVKTDYASQELNPMVILENGFINRAATHDSVPLVDIQSRVLLRVHNVGGFWADSVRLNAGASSTKPHVVFDGCMFSSSLTNPQDVIDETNGIAGATVVFRGCCKSTGEPFTDAVYTTTGP